jgi:hypothetical protein
MQLMGIAEFIIGRAFARPVGSSHPTRYGLIANYTDGPLSFAATRQPSHIEMRTGTNPIT